MKTKWKKVNAGYDPLLFKVFCDAIKLDIFNYSKKRIEKEFDIKNRGRYKLVCKWQDETTSSFNMYKKVELKENKHGNV